MRNRIIILFITIASLFLFTSCKKPQEPDPLIKIQNAIDSIVLPEETTTDIELVQEIDGIQIYWTSNRESVIALDGTVTPYFEDVQVTLTAFHTYEGVTIEKTFTVYVPGHNPSDLIYTIFGKIDIPNVVSENIELPTKIDNVLINWSTSDKYIISNRGVITQGAEDAYATLKATITNEGVTISKEFEICVLAHPVLKEISNLVKDFTIYPYAYKDIDLPSEVNGVLVTWESSYKDAISNDGKVTQQIQEVIVYLTGTFEYLGYEYQKSYPVTVPAMDDLDKIQRVYDNIVFDDVLNSDLKLETQYAFQVKAVWESSNQAVLTNEGIYTYDVNVSSVTLKVTLKLGVNEMQKEFEFTLMPKVDKVKEHLVIERVEDLDSSKFENVEVVNGKLVLTAGSKVGTYESSEIETIEFTSLVASWAAISSTTATVELELKVRVDGVWSDYISYHEWGLGLENALYDQNNSLIKLSTDEVKVLNGKSADGLKYKITLRTTSNTTPEFSLACFALGSPGHVYEVNLLNLPKSLIHDVPLLYQGEVPSIGNSICSPTSATMLLKYKGESFKEFDSEFEHRYMAGIVRDYGNKIYGNWVYNTVAMSAYGYDAYVARFYSIEELVEHLATVGPCALSVKGQMSSDIKNYYTNGHLLVAIGYEIDDNGEITIICNDPNVKGSMCRYSQTVINNTWRYIAYVIE